MRIADRIVVDPAIKFGKPIIEGTRVPVELVLGKLAAGMPIESVMDDYDITRSDVLAALAYAAERIASEEIRALG